jgi:hypothetical protein
MEQRRLRLGDILDDYCPRERRVTNHAIVAMIEEDVKQTRCTTCDAEHAYKGARVPKRRKKESPAALYKEVLAGLPEVDGADAPALAAAVPAVAGPIAVPAEALASLAMAAPIGISAAPALQSLAADGPLPALVSAPARQEPPTPAAAEPEPAESADPPHPDDTGVVDGPVHRRLIRATLPRPEGQKDARPLPEFTVRHAPARGNGNAHGNASFRGPERLRMRGGAGPGQNVPNGNRGQGGPRFHGGNRTAGQGRPAGRGGAPAGFRGGSSGPNKRGRGSRG